MDSYIESISDEVMERARRLKGIFMDVDGVLTAGMIVFDANGVEIKHFNAHDGLACKMATLGGLQTGIISARESGTIRHRAREMGVTNLYLGRQYKLPAFRELLKNLNLQPEECCFIGDDLPDVPVMKQAGLAVAVNNATDIPKEVAHYITRKNGGEGAVREVVELVLKAQGSYESVLKQVWGEE